MTSFGTTDIEYVCVSDRPPSVAVTLKLKSPAAVGVPESRPAELSVKPPGSEPDETAHVGLPPVALQVVRNRHLSGPERGLTLVDLKS